MKKVALMLAIILLSLINIIYPQTNLTLSKETMSAIKQADDFKDLDLYLKARAFSEREYLSNQEINFFRYHVAYCNFRISYIYLNKKDMTNFNKYMDEARKLLKENIEKDDKDAESMALLSTCNGIKITADNSLGQSLGQECMMLIANAKEIAPENPRVILQEGIVKFNFPDFFGGDKIKASELFKRSIEVLKNIKNDNYAWGLGDAYAWYITSLIALNKHNDAKIAAEESLKINPDFAWIKYGLLPKIKQ